MANMRREVDPETGQMIERFFGGPKVTRRLIRKGSTLHPELEHDEVEVVETYPAREVRDWQESLGREGERGKIDGAVTGEFPRKSRLGAAMAEAGLDADALAAKVLLPVELIRGLIDSGEVPGDDQRRQLEAIVPDPFPESGELIEPTPNEINGDAIPQADRRKGRGEPAPTRDEAEARSRRRAQLAAEVRSEANKRAAAVRRQGERDAARRKELDRGLSGIARKLRGIGRE
jgi:hypothetical protein